MRCGPCHERATNAMLAAVGATCTARYDYHPGEVGQQPRVCVGCHVAFYPGAACRVFVPGETP